MKKLLLIYGIFLNYSILLSQGNALSFDGTNDYIDISSVLLPASSASDKWTIEMWINTTTTDIDVLFSQYTSGNNDRSQFHLNFGTSGKAGYWKNSSGGQIVTSSTSVNDGNWHHIAFVKEGSGTNQVHIYVDGTSEASGTDGNPMANINSEIGRIDNMSTPRHFPGSLDEIRIWNIALTAAQVSALYQDEFSDPMTPASCLTAYYQLNESTGSSASDATGNGNTGTLINMDNSDWVASGAGVTSQSAPTCASLPVELTYLKAKKLNSLIQLQWQTASETNNKGFEIEWSTDSRNWKNLGFVNGEGTTIEKQTYSFLHKNPEHGVNYYRLKQTDYDGVFEYSDVVSVELTVDGYRLSVSPNPVQNGEVTLYIPETDFEEVNLEIYNSTGILVQTDRLYSNETTIQTMDLPKGIYLFSVKIEGQRLIRRVIVN